MKKVLLFAGSNSPNSINQSVAMFVSELLIQHQTRVINLRDFTLPIYSIETEETEGIPGNAVKLKEIFDEYDALVISVAENNGSVTAFFKNTLDWISRVERNYKILNNKQVLLLSASPGRGGLSAINHAENILVRLGASVIGKFAIHNFYQQVSSANGRMHLNDEQVVKEITELASKLTL